MDCLVVGYHEVDAGTDDLSIALAVDGDVPVPVRSLMRTQLALDGRFMPYLDGLSWSRRSSDTGRYTVSELPSLGTIYLVNFLRKRGIDADFVNSFTFERERLLELLKRNPVAVAITTTFYLMPAPVIEIVAFIREHDPDVTIVVGGPLVENVCRAFTGDRLSQAFDRAGADAYIWDSQGEATLLEVVSRLRAGRSIDDVPNVFTRTGQTWTMSAKHPEENDLDECSVDWRSFGFATLGPTASTRTARSCAFKCAFCDYPARAGALALADIATVERELEALAEIGIRRVAFIDDTFNVPVRRFTELCQMMVRRDFGIEWFSYFRASHARTPELYQLMYDAGCRGVLLGVESGDDAILKNTDKRATTDDYRFGIEHLKSLGIFTHASIVVGFPGETEATVQRTIDFLNSTGADTFAVNHGYYLHSTPIHMRAADFDLEGVGHNWKHRTMTSREALRAVDRMFYEVKAAAWMPVNGLDFWGVPYLLGKGLEPAEILGFLRRAKPLTAIYAAAGAPPAPIVDAGSGPAVSFQNYCASLPLSAGRYSFDPALVS